jgi:hypothetical protein
LPLSNRPNEIEFDSSDSRIAGGAEEFHLEVAHPQKNLHSEGLKHPEYLSAPAADNEKVVNEIWPPLTEGILRRSLECFYFGSQTKSDDIVTRTAERGGAPKMDHQRGGCIVAGLSLALLQTHVNQVRLNMLLLCCSLNLSRLDGMKNDTLPLIEEAETSKTNI